MRTVISLRLIEDTMDDYVAMLPQIAKLYCVTIDDLFKETSVEFENYA